MTGLEGDNLDVDQRRLWNWLCREAAGRSRAVVIADVAAAMGWSVRRVQDVAAALRKKRRPVITARRDAPRGMFVALEAAELDDYIATLTAISRDVEEQIRVLRRTRPLGATRIQESLF